MTSGRAGRTGLEEPPALLRRIILLAHRHVLGFRLGPLHGNDHVLGWRIHKAEPEVIRLEASGRLLDGVIVGRRQETRTVLTTSLRYRRPLLARTVWICVGPLHRRIAPYLLDRAAGFAGAAR